MLTVEEYVTLDVVAERLERHVEAIEEWVAEGRLPTIQLPSGERCVPRVALWPRRRVSESDE